MKTSAYEVEQRLLKRIFALESEVKAQRDELLAILKDIQAGHEFTPEFCKHLDAVIEKTEATL